MLDGRCDYQCSTEATEAHLCIHLEDGMKSSKKEKPVQHLDDVDESVRAGK